MSSKIHFLQFSFSVNKRCTLMGNVFFSFVLNKGYVNRWSKTFFLLCISTKEIHMFVSKGIYISEKLSAPPADLFLALCSFAFAKSTQFWFLLSVTFLLAVIFLIWPRSCFSLPVIFFIRLRCQFLLAVIFLSDPGPSFHWQ